MKLASWVGWGESSLSKNKTKRNTYYAVWMCRCVDVWMRGCVDAWMYGFTCVHACVVYSNVSAEDVTVGYK